MISLDKSLQRATKNIDKKLSAFTGSVKYAQRDYVNSMAFEARKRWIGEMQSAFVLRNNWTARSVQVDKAKVSSSSAVVTAKTGSVAHYMADQEYGGQKTKGGKHGVAIPTTTAAGQGLKARPRTKQVSARNKMTSIRLAARITGDRRQRNAAAIRMAAKSASKVAYLDLDTRRGLFKIMGSSKRPKIRMLWDLSRTSVEIPRKPTLGPAIDNIAHTQRIRLAVTHLKQQLQRNKLISK